MHCTMYCSIQCNMQYTLHFTMHSTMYCAMECTLHSTIHCIVSALLITTDGVYHCPAGSIWPFFNFNFLTLIFNSDWFWNRVTALRVNPYACYKHKEVSKGTSSDSSSHILANICKTDDLWSWLGIAALESDAYQTKPSYWNNIKLKFLVKIW